MNEQLDEKIKEIFKLYDEEDDYNWTIKYGETPYWEVVKQLIKEEKIKELEHLSSNTKWWYNVSKYKTIKDRIKELKESNK